MLNKARDFIHKVRVIYSTSYKTKSLRKRIEMMIDKQYTDTITEAKKSIKCESLDTWSTRLLSTVKELKNGTSK